MPCGKEHPPLARCAVLYHTAAAAPFNIKKFASSIIMMAWIAPGTQKVVTYSILGWRPSAILQLVNKSDAGPLNATYSRRLDCVLRRTI